MSRENVPEMNTEAISGMDEELRKDVEAVLNLFVRPHISTHGGDLEVTGLDEEGTLWIEMLGECAGCPSADETAKDLVQKEICARIPQIRKVEIDTGIDPELLQEAMKLLHGGKEKS